MKLEKKKDVEGKEEKEVESEGGETQCGGGTDWRKMFKGCV